MAKRMQWQGAQRQEHSGRSTAAGVESGNKEEENTAARKAAEMDGAEKSCTNAAFYAISARILLNSCKRASFSPNFAFDLSFRLKLM
ncbi:hypothetical protein M5W83_02445 [Paenibacillus thiaminolyticus]|uniref:Uncharacterized protein n=1 Tax=Paenibacillus thiaminolyticus TaxID=49283 RepID=A0AAP9J372_PANTH|nr:hypothetical protein [Paenibacillus thiaminolyticus]MCY9535057.1 hypothetical protein [Paenibacillus thiaminolyticus]MCY9605188.1 hypothetical protein [Paenibacillus thiaminolyticus]MCY9606039.1 hypothetical protein [Paenibacillus thiaminolyticus]MCY9615655.1 hypothetical protein [Paenibacillus thiaminolyticus]MCY9620442.1 hypothetical protein [Paenibacillus thiaminolyticus]